MTDQSEPKIFTIANEDAAWALLKMALKEDFDHENTQLVFDNWPRIDIKVTGDKHQASLTAKNMEGLVELQKTVNRSYALLLYNTPNTGNLKKSEKDALELVFTVSPGSSDIMAIFANQLDTFVKAMTEKMKPQHYIVVVLGAGLLWTASTCWTTWLQYQKDMKIFDKETETRQFASEQEFKKMKLISDVAQANPAFHTVQEDSRHMYNQVLKSVSTADTISIAGIDSFTGKTARALIKNEPVKSVEARLDGQYRILKVDSSLQKSFKVHVRNIETDESFVAILQDTVVIKEKHKEYLQEAEWNRKPVNLKINAKRLRGSVTGATILAVERIEENTEG